MSNATTTWRRYVVRYLPPAEGYAFGSYFVLDTVAERKVYGGPYTGIDAADREAAYLNGADVVAHLS